VQWSIDKHYLADLVRARVPTVLTEFIEPGERAGPRIAALLEQPGVTEFVIKPAVGAGSRDAQRYGADERASATEHAHRMLAEQRSVLLQPYLEQVDQHGETALIYFEGVFSHAIRKGPLLRRSEGPTRGLFAAEQITPRVPDAMELQVGARAMAALPFETPLYARVDLIRDRSGAPHVLELELIEPSLFFVHAPGSAERFATAIVARATLLRSTGADWTISGGPDL
jgi:glutathione synthase/RimK-type ligase-like ATP-grasp enzyme